MEVSISTRVILANRSLAGSNTQPGVTLTDANIRTVDQRDGSSKRLGGHVRMHPI
jgi:hypothetical protein